MTLEELHETVVEGFKKVDERFARHDERFARIDERFVEIREEMRQEMRGFRVEIEARIREEHETTRRHFDVMVEKVEAAVRIVAEGDHPPDVPCRDSAAFRPRHPAPHLCTG